jgi:hypothetical protein
MMPGSTRMVVRVARDLGPAATSEEDRSKLRGAGVRSLPKSGLRRRLLR